MTDFTNRVYRDGWMDAIKAVNEQAAPGMADVVREARVQALRDAAAQTSIKIVGHKPEISELATAGARAWLNRRANDIEKGEA